MGSCRASPAGPYECLQGIAFRPMPMPGDHSAIGGHNVRTHVTLIACLVCAESVTTCQVTPGNSSTAKIALKLLGKVSGQWQAVGTAPDVLEQVAAQRTVRGVGQHVGGLEKGRYGFGRTWDWRAMGRGGSAWPKQQ